jgi:hypothetical protein
VWSESALAGVVVLWLASLHALRLTRSVGQSSPRPSRSTGGNSPVKAPGLA